MPIFGIAHGDTLGFSATAHGVAENTAELSVTVSRVGNGAGEASVAYTSADGSALAGSDYAAVSGVLTWSDGDTDDQSIQVPISADAASEGDETFTLTLSSPTGATLGANTSTTVTITNVDGGTLQFTAADFAAAENDGSVNVTVSRVGGTSGAVSVAFANVNDTAIAGSDYSVTGGTLQWGDGDGADKEITITLLDDSMVEGDEAFTINLANPVGAPLGTPTSATITISDFEPGTIAFTANSFSTAEGVGATITVSRTNGSSGAVSVDFATSPDTATPDDDYTDASGTLNWADGEDGEKSFTVTPALDDEVEETETVMLYLTNFSDPTTGNYQQASLSIINTNIVVEFEAERFDTAEGDQWAWLTVNRIGGGHGAVSVSYSANSGNTDPGAAIANIDYVSSSANGTLEWPDGTTAPEVIYLELFDDAIAEGDEPLVITLATPTGATLGERATTTLYIVNDDVDFTLPLEKIQPDEEGITEPAVIDLSQPSPLAADTAMIDLINQLDLVFDGRFNFTQDATSGVLTSSVDGESILALHPVRVETPLTNELPGLHLSDAGEVRIVTGGGLAVVCLPASGNLSALYAAIADAGLAEVIVNAHGDASIPVNAGSAPLEPNDQGELVIPYAWFERFMVRPALSDDPAAEGAVAGIEATPHPTIHGLIQLAHRFQTESDGMREQQLYPALADWSAVHEKALQIGGYQRLIQQLDGTITAWINFASATYLPDYRIERGPPPASTQLEFLPQPDLNGDGIEDLLVSYPNGDRQRIYRLSSSTP